MKSTLIRDTAIFIQTRARTRKQISLAQFPDELKAATFIVCPHDEEEQHKQHGCAGVIGGDWRALPFKRHWIFEHAIRSGIEYLYLVDDDIRFRRRLPNLTTVKSDKDDMIEAFELMNSWLRSGEASMVAMGNLWQVNRKPEVQYGSRCQKIHGYNVQHYFDANCRYDRLVVMEDFDVALTLLRQGYNQMVTNLFPMSDDATGQPGGCSLYRDEAVQERCAKALEALHPTVVKAKFKTTKWCNMLNGHWDVIVQWMRAVEEGRRRKSGDLPALELPATVEGMWP